MIGVYTAIFGNYDTIRPTKYNGTLFTNQTDIPTDTGWHIEMVEPPHPDPRYASRYYFDQSHIAMPDCDYTVMHGGNAILKVHPQELVDLLPKDVDWGCCIHPRGNVYEEAKACKRMGKDDKNVIDAQMARYRKAGFDGIGLSALIIVVRRNTDKLQKFEKRLWQEVSSGSCRDQLSFDYLKWRYDFKVFYLPHRWTHYLDLKGHKK